MRKYEEKCSGGGKYILCGGTLSHETQIQESDFFEHSFCFLMRKRLKIQNSLSVKRQQVMASPSWSLNGEYINE